MSLCYDDFFDAFNYKYISGHNPKSTKTFEKLKAEKAREYNKALEDYWKAAAQGVRMPPMELSELAGVQPSPTTVHVTGKIKQIPDPDVNWGFTTIGDSLYD